MSVSRNRWGVPLRQIAPVVLVLGLTVAGIIPSPLLGGDGNREFFIGAHRD